MSGNAGRRASKRRRASLGDELRRLGFSPQYDRADGSYRVRCDSCEALVINGVACHEAGCPNGRRGAGEDEDD